MSPENIFGSVAESYIGSPIDDSESFINDVVFVYTYDLMKNRSVEPTHDNAKQVEYDITTLANMVGARFNVDQDEVLSQMLQKLIGQENESDYIAEIVKKEHHYFRQ